MTFFWSSTYFLTRLIQNKQEKSVRVRNILWLYEKEKPVVCCCSRELKLNWPSYKSKFIGGLPSNHRPLISHALVTDHWPLFRTGNRVVSGRVYKFEGWTKILDRKRTGDIHNLELWVRFKKRDSKVQRSKRLARRTKFSQGYYISFIMILACCKSSFQTTAEKIYAIAIATLGDWLKNRVPVLKQININTRPPYVFIFWH